MHTASRAIYFKTILCPFIANIFISKEKKKPITIRIRYSSPTVPKRSNWLYTMIFNGRNREIAQNRSTSVFHSRFLLFRGFVRVYNTDNIYLCIINGMRTYVYKIYNVYDRLGSLNYGSLKSGGPVRDSHSPESAHRKWRKINNPPRPGSSSSFYDVMEN